MQNLTQRINLWVGLFLASLSTAATTYYLFQLMAAYPVLVYYAKEMLHTLHSSKKREVEGCR